MNQLEIIKRIKLIDRLIENKKNNSKLNFYNTGDKIHKKQLEFHKNTKKNIILFPTIHQLIGSFFS